jgi:hypothetical protein
VQGKRQLHVTNGDFRAWSELVEALGFKQQADAAALRDHGAIRAAAVGDPRVVVRGYIDDGIKTADC